MLIDTPKQLLNWWPGILRASSKPGSTSSRVSRIFPRLCSNYFTERISGSWFSKWTREGLRLSGCSELQPAPDLLGELAEEHRQLLLLKMVRLAGRHGYTGKFVP